MLHSDDTKFMELMSSFQQAMEDLRAGVRSLLSMYCETFRVHLPSVEVDKPVRGRHVIFSHLFS